MIHPVTIELYAKSESRTLCTQIPCFLGTTRRPAHILCMFGPCAHKFRASWAQPDDLHTYCACSDPVHTNSVLPGHNPTTCTHIVHVRTLCTQIPCFLGTTRRPAHILCMFGPCAHKFRASWAQPDDLYRVVNLSQIRGTSDGAV